MGKKWKAPKGVSVIYKAKSFRKRPKGASDGGDRESDAKSRNTASESDD